MHAELTATEIEKIIAESLSGDDLQWWCGACREVRSEFVALAQAEGIDEVIESLRGISETDSVID